MSPYLKHEVVAKILDVGLVPTFYSGDIETAKKTVDACVGGGAKVVEFTNRGALAYQVFSEIAKWCDRELPDTVFGAGTVIDPATASLYMNSGANFIVGPSFNPEVAKVCNRRKVAYIPGCSTPSEISEAEEMGSDIIKIFPAKALGPSFIEAMLGPCPWVRLMPSGGVEATRQDVFNWIKAGAAALNVGTSLVRKDLVAAGDFEELRNRVEKCILWIKEARGTPLFLGVEHVAVYAGDETLGANEAEWYSKAFGFDRSEAKASIMVSGKGFGRLEVMKTEKKPMCHIAIHVSNLEEACKELRNKGFELEEPIIRKGLKIAYLKDTDPLGNKVHLICTT